MNKGLLCSGCGKEAGECRCEPKLTDEQLREEINTLREFYNYERKVTSNYYDPRTCPRSERDKAKNELVTAILTLLSVKIQEARKEIKRELEKVIRGIERFPEWQAYWKDKE